MWEHLKMEVAMIHHEQFNNENAIWFLNNLTLGTTLLIQSTFFKTCIHCERSSHQHLYFIKKKRFDLFYLITMLLSVPLTMSVFFSSVLLTSTIGSQYICKVYT